MLKGFLQEEEEEEASFLKKAKAKATLQPFQPQKKQLPQPQCLETMVVVTMIMCE